MKRTLIDTITINNIFLADDIMSGLCKLENGHNYEFEVLEETDKNGCVEHVTIKIYIVTAVC